MKRVNGQRRIFKTHSKHNGRLRPGTKGVLVTNCPSNKHREAIQEACTILRETCEHLFPPTTPDMQDEITAHQTLFNRFKPGPCLSRALNFILFTHPDDVPSAYLHHILSARSSLPSARFLAKMIPIDCVCRGDLGLLERVLRGVVARVLPRSGAARSTSVASWQTSPVGRVSNKLVAHGQNQLDETGQDKLGIDQNQLNKKNGQNQLDENDQNQLDEYGQEKMDNGQNQLDLTGQDKLCNDQNKEDENGQDKMDNGQNKVDEKTANSLSSLDSLVGGKKADETDETDETDENQTWALEYDGRSWNGFGREEVIKLVGELVGSEYKVDLKQPDVLIVVQCVKNCCGVSVLGGYKKVARYRMSMRANE